MKQTLPPFNRRPPRKHRQRQWGAPPVTPPAALTLVAAEYVESDSITLTFSRAIDISAMDGWEISVDDSAISGFKYFARGPATLLAPETVRIGVDDGVASVEPGTHLTATAGNGIVSIDGVAWEGVTGLVLPFGE